jgi:pimeloyl-ACP methyl ester carboxylesterase
MVEFPARRIDYREQGSGPTILFVPGSWSTGALWRDVIALLGDRFRAVTTSLLGYGDTEERRTLDDISIEREVDVIEAVIQRTNSAVHLVGHSYGGTVCLATALRDRTKIASMTLIEATPFNLLRHSGDLGLYQQVRAVSGAYVRWCDNGKLLAARTIIDFYGGDGSFDTFSARTRDYIAATTPTNLLDWSSAVFRCAACRLCGHHCTKPPRARRALSSSRSARQRGAESRTLQIVAGDRSRRESFHDRDPCVGCREAHPETRRDGRDAALVLALPDTCRRKHPTSSQRRSPLGLGRVKTVPSEVGPESREPQVS